MPEKRFTPRTRPSGYRDAKLIIIAAEGSNTEKRYFEDLAGIYYKPNVHIEVLDRLNTNSDPKTVIESLDNFRKYYSLRKNFDELWLVIDVDRWGGKKLSDVGTQCFQKNYGYAVSNPCFELWLLLHLKSLEEYPEEKLHEFLENKRKAKYKRTPLELELVNILGAYNKGNLDTSKILSKVNDAIEQARKLDRNPEHRWPAKLGTRVYLIAEKIIKNE